MQTEVIILEFKTRQLCSGEGWKKQGTMAFAVIRVETCICELYIFISSQHCLLSLFPVAAAMCLLRPTLVLTLTWGDGERIWTGLGEFSLLRKGEKTHKKREKTTGHLRHLSICSFQRIGWWSLTGVLSTKRRNWTASLLWKTTSNCRLLSLGLMFVFPLGWVNMACSTRS